MKKSILFILSFFLATGTLYARKPNIILFIADDLTWRDIGCYGGQCLTPNIDRLAGEGMKFDRCYEAVPVCAPTRMNLYTGLYPVKSGAYPQGSFVKEGTRSLPHYLRELGYRVALVGKRHIQPPEAFPFEYVDSGEEKLDMKDVDRFLAGAGESPFALVVASQEPHYRWDLGDTTKYKEHELQLPPNWIDTRETREYYRKYLAESTYLDWQLGEVMHSLEKYGLAGRTALFFTSEQGNSFPYSKWTCYESGVHTAMIVRWPGVTSAGSSSEALIDYTDVLPTFIEMAGGSVPPVLDGESFLPALKGEPYNGSEYTFSMQTTRGEPWGGDFFGIRCVRDRQYTYIINFTPYMLFECHLTRYGDGFFNSWREAGWHDAEADRLFLNYTTRPAVELYDRTTDPYEMKNLAGDPSMRAVEKRLSDALAGWMQYCGDKGQQTEMEALEHQYKHYKQVHQESGSDRK